MKFNLEEENGILIESAKKEKEKYGRWNGNRTRGEKEREMERVTNHWSRPLVPSSILKFNDDNDDELLRNPKETILTPYPSWNP